MDLEVALTSAASGSGARADAAVARASGLLFVVSGPSGVGKSTLVEALKHQGFPITYCITATTRPRRAYEEHGIHYYFLTDAEYEALLSHDEFLEHAVVHSLYRYGVPLFSLREALGRGKDVIMTPDVEGAATVRRKLPSAITIFLRPETVGELLPRLEARGTESEAERLIRLATAEQEMVRQDEYDYVVVNRRNHLDAAVADIGAIIRAERLRARPRTVEV